MELGKEDITLGENKDQEKISIVVNANKDDNKEKIQVNSRRVVEKKSLKDTLKQQFTSRKFKGGAFSSIFIVFILVAVVLVNMIVGQFDLRVDLTTESTYTLTDQTKEVTKDIKDDITLYYIVENGQEITLFKNIVEKYEELSDKIKLVYKDPVLYPTFAEQYAGKGTTVDSNSIVVVNEKTKKYKFIPYNQMYSLDYTEVYNGTATDPELTAIDVEGQITSAIKLVTREEMSKIYTVSGHGETLLSDYLKNEFTKLGVETEPLNIRSVGSASTENIKGVDGVTGANKSSVSIPEDCDILYICGPSTD